MNHKQVLSKLLITFLIGIISVAGILMLLPQGASARPVIQKTEADLALTQVTSPDPAIAGEALTYILTITNSGPLTATDVTVTDTLPSGVTFDSTSTGCSHFGGTVTCSLSTLAVSETATLTTVVAVHSSTTSTLSSSAAVTATTTDPDMSNNTAQTETDVSAEADLVVSKADDPEPVVAGAALTYTLTVTNSGPSDATGVTVTDTLSSGVTFVSVTTRQGICSGASGVVTCALGTLTYDDSTVVSIIVTPTASGIITNRVEVSANETDDAPGNNTHTITTTVNPGANLSLTKMDSHDPTIAGTALTYTLTIVNYGPSDATGVYVTDTLPSGVTFVSATASPGTTYDSGTGVWTVGDLANSSSATLTITVTTARSARGTITNVATASANEADPAPANNTVTESTLVNGQADLAVTKQDTPDPVIAGTTLTYTLTATNYGPSDATSVTVTDTLPSGVTFVSATPSQGSYNSGTSVWTVGALVLNGTASLTIRATVASSITGVVWNTATISSSETDAVSGNNTTAVGTQVNAEVHLTFTKSATPTVNAGDPLTYTIGVTNTGPSDATNLVITDTLDHHVTYTSASPAPDGFSNGDIFWNIARLAPNHSARITLRVQVHSPLTNNTTLTNVTWLDTDQTAPTSTTRTTTVHSSPVLTITKTDYPDPVDAGKTLRYTIAITNSGNENATAVTVTEDYDPNISFSFSNPAPDLGSGDRVWTFPTLNVGSPRTINIVVQVASPLPVGTVLTNRATLDSAQTMPITATQITSVTSASALSVTKVDSSDPAQAGEDLFYFINYSNFGTAPAEDVVITETYDDRVTFLSANPAPRPGTNNVWEFGDLLVGQGGSITVRVRVDTPLPNGTVMTNYVTIDSTYTSPRTISETTTVSSAPELAFNVTDYPDPVAAGTPLTYTLRYTNTGNADATSTVITATLDGRTSFVSAVPPPTGGSGQVRYWNIGTVAGEGGSGQIVIRANVTSPLTNNVQLQFEAQLRDAEGDLMPATAQTRVTSRPILSFDKNNGVDIVYAGDLLTYTLTYTNTGNENASNVTITDTLPNYVTYVGCQVEAGDCQAVPPTDPDLVIFHISVITQTPRVARLTVQVLDPLPAQASSVDNRAVMAHSSLTVPIEKHDEDPIGTLADLMVTVDHTPVIFSPGQRMTYTVHYGNVGQHMDAEDVIITTIIPTGTTYAGFGWHSNDGRTYTYAVGDLPAGSTGHTITFTVVAPNQPDCVQNGVPEFRTPFIIAGDGGAGRDAHSADNTAYAYVGVPDLVVLGFTVEPLPPRPGAPVTFTILLKNVGTGEARNPSLTGGPFWMDIFTATVPSCPWARYSESDLFLGVPPLAPGEERTFAFTKTFTEQQIRTIEAFYVKVDNYKEGSYGLVPESNEMNNVAGPVYPWPHYTYLPLVLRQK